MAYLDVISLDEAKTYLKIDEEQEETDSEITSMLKAAFRYVERHTNILAYARNKEYFPIQGEVRIYDYPINDTIDDSERRPLYTIVRTCEPITVNVGYIDPLDVEADFKQAVLGVLKAEFYGQDEEDNGDFRKSLPAFVVDFIQSQKRFII